MIPLMNREFYLSGTNEGEGLYPETVFIVYLRL